MSAPTFFEGKWDLISSQNLYEFLSRVGAKKGRIMSIEWRPTLGGGRNEWTETVITGTGTRSCTYTFGKEFVDITSDGRTSKVRTTEKLVVIQSVVRTVGGNTLTQHQEVGYFVLECSRVFDGTQMETTFRAPGVNSWAKATFRKCRELN